MQGGDEMSRKGWLTLGLSLLLGTGVTAAVPAVGVQTARAQDVLDYGNIIEHRAQVQAARWGDESGEQGEIEAPRWGDQSGEQGEIEAPRWGDQSGEQGEIEAPRWGDQNGEQGEIESPRA
jgi:hypothetical protein